MIILFTYALMGMYLLWKEYLNTQNGIQVYSPNIQIIEYSFEP